MIVFPQIERLVVHNYGLYPGASAGEGLDLNLSSGPWIVLGVNGLGKSTLLLMMAEKSKEIAILKALGATDGAIMRTFMTEGVIIGGIGTILGVSTGLALCTGLSWFGLRLDPDVYYIDRLPINVSGWDYLAVTVVALTICTDRKSVV